MRIVYASQPNRVGTGWLWSAMLRFAVLMTAALVLLAITLVGVFVVLPLMIAGGIALSFFLRRRLRQAQQRPKDSVIDADYTVIRHRER